MSDLLNLVLDTFPASNDVGVPLSSYLSITLSGTNYDESSLLEGCFLEGPDTDQYVGPGLELLQSPDNMSQGNLDDFLRSPGYRGIAVADITVSGSSGNTIVRVKPSQPMAALTEYVLNLTFVLENDGVTEINGHVTIPFTTGTGSIEVIPTTTSTSILARTTQSPLADTSATPLKVLSITPKDHAVQVPVTLNEIVVEFNKDLDPSVDADSILIQAVPATDHPNLAITCNDTIAKQVTVEGNRLRIKI
jgi:hypothetical protein